MDNIGWGRLLRLSSAVLALAALAIIAGHVAQVLSFPGLGTRVTLEGFSLVADGVNGLLVLGAVLVGLVAMQSPAVARDGNTGGKWPLLLAGVLGAVLCLAALFAVVDAITVHIPSPGAAGQPFHFGLSAGRGWDRLATILQRVGGGLLGAWAAWLVAVRQRVFSPSERLTNVA